MAKTPKKSSPPKQPLPASAEEVDDISTEDIAEPKNALHSSDANDDADAREEAIELDNDTVDELVDESQEISDEGIDSDGHDRG